MPKEPKQALRDPKVDTFKNGCRGEVIGAMIIIVALCEIGGGGSGVDRWSVMVDIRHKKRETF